MLSLKSLNKYFLKYKSKLALGILFILISNAAQVYLPILIKDSIDLLKSNFSYQVLTRYAILIVAVAIFGGFFRFLIRTTIIIVSRRIEYDLRMDFWEHIQKLPIRFFQNNSTGNIMSHVTNDINSVRMYIGPAVMYSIDTVSKFIIVITIMLTLAPDLTLYALLPLPILSFLVYKLSKKIHTKYTKIQEKFSELTTKAQENFSGIRVIKSYVREESEINQFKKLSYDYLKRNMSMVKVQAFFAPLLFLITGVSVIIVIWIGGSMVIENKLTLGELVAFVAYLALLIWPVIAFGWVLNIIQQAAASMKRILKIFAEEEEIFETEITDKNIKEIEGQIEFKNVSFKYGINHEDVLKNISFKVPKGSTLAIIGHTGSGKTTLVNLLPRLFQPTEGNIFIDGKNINEIPISVLRKNIGLVTQETFLFSDTLSNNILYGIGNSNETLAREVTEISKLSKDLDDFNNGFNTMIGERGITLSGGQKQRASLARALAINPKILILDDSFSAVDTNTEEEILKNLNEFRKGRTSIIISHRISTVKNADNIIVLKNGIIVENGKHDQLVKLKGIYADLFTKQLLEEELKAL